MADAEGERTPSDHTWIHLFHWFCSRNDSSKERKKGDEGTKPNKKTQNKKRAIEDKKGEG